MSPYIGYDSDTTFIPGTLNTSSSLTIQGGGITQTGGDVNFDSGTLFIDEDLNRVGIGTTAPAYLIDAHSALNAQFRLKSGTDLAQIILDANSTVSGVSQINFADSDANNVGLISYYHSDNSLRFTINGIGNERLRIKSDGDIIVGNPSHDGTSQTGTRTTLTVADTTNGALLQIRGPDPAIFFDKVGTSTNKILIDDVDLAVYSGNPILEGSELICIKSTGNVGIGTTNPLTKLHVFGDWAAGQGILKIDTTGNFTGFTAHKSGSTKFAFYNDNSSTLTTIESADALRFFVSGSEKAHIKSNGHVDITNGDQSSDAALNIYKSAGDDTNKAVLRIGYDQTNSFELYRTRADGTIYMSASQSGSDISVLTNNTGSLGERLRITSTGNVGIGTTNPVALLQVGGTAGVNTNFTVASSTTGDGGVYFHDGANSGAITYNHNSDYMLLRVNGAERLRIKSDGSLYKGNSDSGQAIINQNVTYSSGYTGIHWMFESNQGIAWSFQGVFTVKGSSGSSYGARVEHITIVYSREQGALDSGDPYRQGDSVYNVQVLGHNDNGLNPSSGTLTWSEETNPDGASSTRSLFKLSYNASGQGVGVNSYLIGTLYWNSQSGTGTVEIQDKDGNIKFTSN